MRVEYFISELKKINICAITGVPDSTLKPFCDYLNSPDLKEIQHYITPNEGSAVGLATGMYLSTGKPAAVYMQNSGIGNIVNPLTSIVNSEVYGIPMLFIVGWRGEPGIHDEPQHKFMGKITPDLLKLLQVDYEVISNETTEDDLRQIFETAEKRMELNKQYAIIVKKDTFIVENKKKYNNGYSLVREDAISELIRNIKKQDVIVSTTGKISREIYEQFDKIKGYHDQAFLTVGGMGYASMIALGMALKYKNKRVYCIDGDGAILMHMGSLAMIGQHAPNNLVHICMNNEAHESVGGMPTAAVSSSWLDIARSCGYKKIFEVNSIEDLNTTLKKISENKALTFIVVNIALGSRENLGRPRESAEENKIDFMKYHNPPHS